MSANTTDSIGVFKCKVLERYSSIQYSSHTEIRNSRFERARAKTIA